jgi:transcriptional regulator with XRE-family HTH domain
METGEHIPQWTMADRLRKSREDLGLDQQQMAERLGIARQSVSNYERGHTRPLRLILRQWALATGVPEWWLRSGDVSLGSGTYDSVTRGRPGTGWFRRKAAKPRRPPHHGALFPAGSPNRVTLLRPTG